MRALQRYLRKHGKRIVSILSIIGQNRVKISLNSLFPYHSSETGYSRLMEAVGEIEQSATHIRELQRRGVKLVVVNGTYYLESDLETIKKLIREAS